MRLLLVLPLLQAALLVAPPVAGAELGRLFFTPEQRGALDARRKAKIPDKPPPPVNTSVAESPVTRVDGFVSRGSGKSTVWVNGEPIPEGTQPQGMRVHPRRPDSSRVTVELAEPDAQINLKIGQSFDRGTGEVRDSLGGGEFKVNPPPRGK